MTIPAHTAEFFIGFTDGSRGEPWHWSEMFTKRGYRHAIALTPDGAGTIIVNGLSWRLHVERVAIPIGWVLRHFMLEGFWFVYHRATIRARPWRPAVLSCVEIIKALIGIRAPLVITPWQLYRRLRSLGATPVLWRT